MNDMSAIPIWAVPDSWKPRPVDPEVQRKVDDAFRSRIGYPGRMISGSKSGYRQYNPKGVPMFNANVVLASAGKVWYGDLDMVADKADLIMARNEIGEDLYVLYEHDARFDHEGDEPDVMVSRAWFAIREDRIDVLNRTLIERHGKTI